MEIKVWDSSFTKEDIEVLIGRVLTEVEWDIVADELYNNDELYDLINRKVYEYADRRLAGATLDKGDISGVPGVTIEIKNHAKLDLAGWTAELEIEMKNDSAWTGVVLHKRKGKGNVDDWYATMPAKIWIELIREITNAKRN